MGAFSAMGVMLFASGALAATSVTVTSTVSGTGVTGCTLQEAVIAAGGGATGGCTVVGSGSPRTVILAANTTYKINNRLAPSTSMTIRGPGPGALGRTIIETDNGFTANSAVFMQTVSSARTITLQDLTLRRTTGSSVSGIRIAASPTSAEPTMSLLRVRITGFNDSGVYVNEGLLTVEDSIIENNSTATNGGGIRFTSTVSHWGMSIKRSLVRNNLATDAGGGLYVIPGGASSISHTTIAQNGAHSGGGTFVQPSQAGYLEHNYTTIAENDAFSGGGIYCNGCDSRVRTFASVIAYNSAALGYDIDGYVESTSCLWSATDEADQADHFDFYATPVDPGLGFLNDLGGNVGDLDGDGRMDGMLGYLPVTGSLALDRVEPEPLGQPRDQRSFLRGIETQGVAWNDVGAIEKGPWEADRISQFALSGSATHSIDPSSGSDMGFTDGKAMRLRANIGASSRFVTYEVPIAETGTYEVRVKIRRLSSGIAARLEWSPNGSSPWTNLGSQDFFASSTTDTFFVTSATVSTLGHVYFRWITTATATSSRRDVITDYIKLTKL